MVWPLWKNYVLIAENVNAKINRNIFCTKDLFCSWFNFRKIVPMFKI